MVRALIRGVWGWWVAPSINTCVTSSGATAVKVVLRSRGRRMVRHVGSAHDEAELVVLMEKARQIGLPGVSRTVVDCVGQAALLLLTKSCSASLGVRYPSAE